MTSAIPLGIEIATPGDWIEVSLPELGDEGAVERALDERISEAPALAAHREDLMAAVARAGQRALEAGVAFAAVLAAERAGDPVLANVSLTHRPGILPEAEGDDTIEIPIGPDGEPSGPPPPETVTLPAGQAAREEVVHEFAVPGTEAALTMLTVTYLIPVPCATDVAVLTFASPTIGHRMWLVDLFHAIAETVCFRWE